jgi:hypothetical protein
MSVGLLAENRDDADIRCFGSSRAGYRAGSRAVHGFAGARTAAGRLCGGPAGFRR